MIYRTVFILLALGSIMLGLVVGTLNSDPVVVDLLWVQIDWPLGLVILVSLIAGFALGLLLVWLMSVLPLRMRIRKLESDRKNPEKVIETVDD
ncbi:MAG TPA: LapA family protein [Xanthomonadales bacterium]|nr:LapA family protein [Xanthomonadales bacterium]